jgi:DNA-binding NarL/FixJ family response regulator
MNIGDGQSTEIRRSNDSASRTCRQQFLDEFGSSLLRVSSNERLVLDYVLAGHTNKAISHLLGISQRCVELRKASLMRKLNVHTHTQLIREITRFETLRECLEAAS